MRGFSGHLPPDQLLVLWDLVSQAILFIISENNFVLATDSWLRQPRGLAPVRDYHPQFSQRESDAGLFTGQHRGHSGGLIVDKSAATSAARFESRLNVFLYHSKFIVPACNAS